MTDTGNRLFSRTDLKVRGVGEVGLRHALIVSAFSKGGE